MSIVRCEDCGKRIDLDIEEAKDLHDDGMIWLCEDCNEDRNLGG